MPIFLKRLGVVPLLFRFLSWGESAPLFLVFLLSILGTKMKGGGGGGRRREFQFDLWLIQFLGYEDCSLSERGTRVH